MMHVGVHNSQKNGLHHKNIFASVAVIEKVFISILEINTKHGVIIGRTQTQETKFYNFVAILSVGYRVNSKNVTAFRIWTNKVLKQYLLQGNVSYFCAIVLHGDGGASVFNPFAEAVSTWTEIMDGADLKVFPDGFIGICNVPTMN